MEQQCSTIHIAEHRGTRHGFSLTKETLTVYEEKRNDKAIDGQYVFASKKEKIRGKIAPQRNCFVLIDSKVWGFESDAGRSTKT